MIGLGTFAAILTGTVLVLTHCTPNPHPACAAECRICGVRP